METVDVKGTEGSVQSHPELVVHDGIHGDFGGASLNVSHITTLDMSPINVSKGNKACVF